MITHSDKSALLYLLYLICLIVLSRFQLQPQVKSNGLYLHHLSGFDQRIITFSFGIHILIVEQREVNE